MPRVPKEAIDAPPEEVEGDVSKDAPKEEVGLTPEPDTNVYEQVPDPIEHAPDPRDLPVPGQKIPDLYPPEPISEFNAPDFNLLPVQDNFVEGEAPSE